MDWIDQALLEDDQIREQNSSEYNLSGEWCTQWMYDPNKIHDVVEHLADLRQTFTNFAKLLERDDIEFRFSTGEDLGTACAYFKSIDGNRFSQPVIVIDTGLFKKRSCARHLQQRMQRQKESFDSLRNAMHEPPANRTKS